MSRHISAVAHDRPVLPAAWGGRGVIHGTVRVPMIQAALEVSLPDCGDVPVDLSP